MITCPKVLVIDGDPAIHRLLGIILRGEGYTPVSARTGREGLALAASGSPDLCILDLELPGNGGFSVLEALCGAAGGPVMVVTARSGVDEKVRALDAGACDYITKPFSGSEVAARVRAHLRLSRTVSVNVLSSEPAAPGSSVRQFHVNGQKLELTSREEFVLRSLTGSPGELVTSRSLMESIWGGPSSSRRHELRVYVARLRRKLEACGAPDLIVSEMNAGYRLSTGARVNPALAAP